MSDKIKEIISDKELTQIKTVFNKDKEIEKHVLNGMPVEILKKLPKAKFAEFLEKIKTMFKLKV